MQRILLKDMKVRGKLGRKGFFDKQHMYIYGYIYIYMHKIVEEWIF